MELQQGFTSSREEVDLQSYNSLTGVSFNTILLSSSSSSFFSLSLHVRLLKGSRESREVRSKTFFHNFLLISSLLSTLRAVNLNNVMGAIFYNGKSDKLIP